MLVSKALTIDKFGEPEDVLSLSEMPVGEVGDDELLVKMCAAPMHPSDLNTIQGVYGIKPKLPAVIGNEGVGKVIRCGSMVKGFTVGDVVIPSVVSSGTWQTYFRGKAGHFFRVSHPIPAAHAAVFRTNPGTALRLIKDFANLLPNDVIIQNGSTSAVGIYVIQMAKLLGLRTINLFRSRSTPEATEKTRQVLLDYGATWALTEAEFTEADDPTFKKAREAGPVKLALNCLGGRPAIVLLRALGPQGTLVTYGGMTKNPMPIPVAPLIFRDLRLRGFWMSEWIRTKPRPAVDEMFEQLAQWFSNGSIRPSPYTEVPFSDWKHAVDLAKFDDAGPTGIRTKIILNMEREQ